MLDGERPAEATSQPHTEQTCLLNSSRLLYYLRAPAD